MQRELAKMSIRGTRAHKSVKQQRMATTLSTFPNLTLIDPYSLEI